MMQRWSNRVTEPLRIFLRRGALFVLGSVTALTLTVSPFMTQPAAAQFDFSFGGNSCAIETVGWVICPTMRSISRLADNGFTYINQSSLSIDYGLFNGSGKTFTAWEVMRNIANGLFVIVFLVIIYRYLAGSTGGTYNFKRLLPRLIIVGILMNLSFYIAVIFVDISNILGDSIWNFMKNIYGGGSPVMPLGAVANPLNEGNLTKMTAAAMGNAMMVWALLPPLAAVSISVAVISAATVILIIMREAVVTALILAAPVLIALYLLPNMERFSSQAMRLFFQLLILYPIIAILLGTGQIVSLAAGGWDNPSAFYGGGTMSIVPDLVAAAAAVTPLLGTWFIFKNMSALMSTAGSRLSATVAGRRGGKDDEKARVTGKATAGAAANKNAGLGNLTGRRQAFSRNKRRRSLGGSSLTGEADLPETPERTAMANRRPAGDANNDALQNSINGGANEDPEKKLEELQNAKIGDADAMNVESAVAAAMASGTDGKEQEKQKTAKDIFNNLNRGHESKDKDRKFDSGSAPAGGGAAASGTPQPTAPSTSYRAPSMAQSGNIVSGGSAPQQQVKVVAVPVQVDGSALLGGQNQHRPPENVTQPPISGTEEKAKARAQKYLFDADRDIKEASDKIDILGNNSSPSEPPHVDSKGEKDKEDSK